MRSVRLEPDLCEPAMRSVRLEPDRCVSRPVRSVRLEPERLRSDENAPFNGEDR